MQRLPQQHRAHVKVAEDGSIFLPPEFRQALGVESGDEVTLILENGRVRISAIRKAIEHAQAIVRSYNPEGRSLVDELIAERRREAKAEE